MKTISYTVNRIILESAEEKAIRKSWGKYWSEMRRMEKAHGCFYVIVGEWSGYRESQRKIVHVDIGSSELFEKTDYVPNAKSSDYEKSVTTRYLGTVIFSDNTTLEVVIHQITFEDLLNDRLFRKNSYTSVIQSLIKSGDKTYTVKYE